MPYVIGIIVIVLIAIGFAMLRGGDTEENTVAPVVREEVAETPVVTETESSPTTETSEIMTAALPDGTYTTSVTYQTPNKAEYLMDVSLITTSGIVTDAAITYSQGAEKDPNAQRFEKAYKTEVIGKAIDEIDLSRVGGASLTTNAFNEAVGKIIAENT